MNVSILIYAANVRLHPMDAVPHAVAAGLRVVSNKRGVIRTSGEALAHAVNNHLTYDGITVEIPERTTTPENRP